MAVDALGSCWDGVVMSPWTFAGDMEPSFRVDGADCRGRARVIRAILIDVVRHHRERRNRLQARLGHRVES
jgi:hypothetical protein